MPHIDFFGPDGKKWPSATELTALLPQEWLWEWYKHSVEKDGWAGWLKNKEKSEYGKKFGTKVHNHMETIVGECPFIEPLDNSLEVARKLYDFVNPKVAEYIKIEPHLVSNKLKIHGTADILYKKHGDSAYYVGDYKTSFKKDSIAHPIQLAVYALCWNEENGQWPINEGSIFRIDKASLAVKEDVYTNLKQYFPIVKALRIIWGHTYGLD